jgi:curved DNA-binding protein CbpA
MKRNWLIVLAVILVVIIIESQAKKIPNPYKVLGISQNANDEQIRQAFKKRSKKYHPDRNTKDPRAKQKF